MSSLVGPDEDVEAGKVPVPEEVQDAIRTDPLVRRRPDT